MIATGFQSVVLALVTFASTINAPSCTKAQPAQSQQREGKSPAMSPQEARRVEEAADRFVRRFRETLDFGTVFEEMAASNALQILRKIDFFRSINISPQLVAKLDEATLRRVYKAYMNEYYLRGAYDLSVEPPDGVKSGSPPPPPEITAMISASKYRPLLAAGWDGSLPTITTKAELEEYLSDLNKVAALYRSHLSSETFNSPTYKAAIKRVNEYRDVDFRAVSGVPELGVDANVKAYVIEKDFFIFVFVEEQGSLKVLALSMGD